MSYYSFVFDNETIETTIDKIQSPDGSITYKLVLAEKEVSKKIGSHLEIKEQNGLFFYNQPIAQTAAKYADDFLKRFQEFLGWISGKGWLD